MILPYAELQFILSELAFRGIITGNAQTYYENGVKAAIEQWGAVVPANYFANPKVAYDGTLERIMLQKYVALFFVDHQFCGFYSSDAVEQFSGRALGACLPVYSPVL